MALLNRAYVYIDGDQYECASANVSASGNKEPIKAMNRRNRARGHKRGVPQYDLSLEFHHDGTEDADFITMMEDGTEFSVIFQYEDDYTEIYEGCEVYSVDKNSAEGDGVTYSLEITALDRTKSS